MTRPITIRQRVRKITTYDDNEFFGYYRGCTIQVERETFDGDYPTFWIWVHNGDGGALYNGGWRPGYDAIMDDAVREALSGSGLLPRPPHNASQAVVS